MPDEDNVRTVVIDGVEFRLTADEQIESLQEFEGNFKQDKKKKED